MTYPCDKCGKMHKVVKRYPTGGDGAVLLCFSCWVLENRYRFERGRETGQPENWPQLNWYEAHAYTYE